MLDPKTLKNALTACATLALLLLAGSPAAAGPNVPCVDDGGEPIDLQWLEDATLPPVTLPDIGPRSSSVGPSCVDQSVPQQGIPVWCWIRDDDTGAQRTYQSETGEFDGPGVHARMNTRVHCYNQKAPNYFANIPDLRFERSQSITWCQVGEVGASLYDCSPFTWSDGGSVDWSRDEFCVAYKPLDCAVDWFVNRWYGFSYTLDGRASILCTDCTARGTVTLRSDYSLSVPRSNGYILAPDNSVVHGAVGGAYASCDPDVDADGDEHRLHCWTHRTVPIAAYRPYERPEPTQDPVGYVSYCVRDPEPPQVPCP